MPKVVPNICTCCGAEVSNELPGLLDNGLFPCAQCGLGTCISCLDNGREDTCSVCRGRKAAATGRRPNWLDALRGGGTPSHVRLESLIGTQIRVLVDRPLGSSHPMHGFLYPLNYGFLPGTVSGDGEAIDAYILGVDYAIRRFKGEVIAVLERAEEDDPKLIVVEKGRSYTDDEILAATHFQEQHFTVTIRRGPRLQS